MTGQTWVNWPMRRTNIVGGLGWRDSLYHRPRADGRAHCGRPIPANASPGVPDPDERCKSCERSRAA
jgi:hypothetical protein